MAVPVLTPGCENCGATLQGEFCHQCGQAARPPARSLREFLRELGADLAQLDSRALRSLVFLLGRPGFLTRQYLDGRRVRFARPLQLYLVAAAMFFLVNAYRPFIAFDPQTREITSSLSSAAARLELSQAEIQSRAPGLSLETFGERFRSTAAGYLPTLLIGSVLLFALLLLLSFRRSGRTYLEHTVFALHWSAFYLILMMVERLVPQHGSVRRPVEVVLTVTAFAYLALALRRVYEPSWPGALAKAAGLFVGFQALLVIWMLSAISLAFALL